MQTERKSTISIKIFNQIHFSVFHLCGNVIKKRLDDLNILAGMAYKTMAFERELHPYG